jgi:hypothetical protein
MSTPVTLRRPFAEQHALNRQAVARLWANPRYAAAPASPLLAFPGLAEAVIWFPDAVVRVALMFTAGLVGFYRPGRDAFLLLPKEQGQIR